MLVVDFKSRNIANYEKTNEKSIYDVIDYRVSLAVEFFKIGTGHFEEDDELYDAFDSYRKEKGGIIPLVDWMIDLCEDGGFFTGYSGQDCKTILKGKMEKAKRLALMTQDEKAKEAAILVMQKLKETTGTKSSSDIL